MIHLILHINYYHISVDWYDFSNHRTMLYLKHIDMNEAINQAFFALYSTEAVIIDATLKMRSIILQLQKDPRTLPQSLTAEAVSEEVDAPNEFLCFQTLYEELLVTPL